VVNVTADVREAVASPNDIVRDVEANVLPDLLADYSGLTYSLAGEQKEQAESMKSLAEGFVMALLAIFALLAVAFRSYVQPVIIMTVIPFGLVGAVIGHLLMGYDLSLMSGMGIVAASGVVVNDSLILIVAINRYRADGLSVQDAIVAGGGRRFRPILLTSLTTFFGLTPMILETSVQARFLIPMAISLGFGVLFATFITLLLVPALYCIVEDARLFLGRAWRVISGRDDSGHQGPKGPAKEATATVGK
jgi:multidrug efflux pump subunit AcrB